MQASRTISENIYLSNYIILGNSHVTKVPFLGSIDLSKFSITVDGVPLFSGNQTGIDTIKEDDYTVVGTPTISDDGIASDFSSSDYITKDSLTIGGTSWELKAKVYTVNNEVNNKYQSIFCVTDVLADTGYTQVLSLRANRYGNGVVFSVMQDSSTLYQLVHAVSTTDLNVNEWNDISVKYENQTLYIYTNNVLLTSESVDLDSFSITQPLYIGYGIGTQAQYGSIDLNAIVLYVNGDLVYQPCLKIPYTQSKTGSKIADCAYYDRVKSMYDEYGYAPYYTIDEDNETFSLPMGEVYGMIEHKASSNILDLLATKSLTEFSSDIVEHVGYEAFKNFIYLTSVNLPVCTSVETGAFYGCTSLSSVVLPACTSVGSQGFTNCSRLTELELDACTTLGNYAFQSCTSLSSVSLPVCTTFGLQAFQSCTGLTEFDLSSAESISNYCFQGCTGLKKVWIPSTCTTISAASYSRAPFYGCSSTLEIYTDVASEDDIPSGWDTYWNYYASSSTLTVHYGSTYDEYEAAEGGNSGSTSLDDLLG